MDLQENLQQVEANICKACENAGRKRSDVTLIAVSKTKPVEMLQTVYDLGPRDFGENKVQEMCGKMEVLPKDIRWHMIGHLQRNKVHQVLGKAVLIHSVDSLRLARQIEEEAAKKNMEVDILLEINVAKEESKYGFFMEDAEAAIREISTFPHVHIRGLMTIAPFVENPEENREIFKKLYEFAVDIGRKNIDNVTMDVLSMGMTGDYEVAVEEGATMVRVGTGIFGERHYGAV